MAKSQMSEFLVIRRYVNYDDEVASNVRMIITDAPQDTTVAEVEEIIKKLHFTTDVDGGEEVIHENINYRIVTSASLEGAKEEWKRNALWEAEKIKADELGLTSNGLYPVEEFTYDELLDRLDDEKRFTLRLPIGLHSALVKASKGKSLNQFCVDTLAKTVEYKFSARELT